MRQLFAIALMAMVVLSKKDKKDRPKKRKGGRNQIEEDDDAIQPLIDESAEFNKFTAKYNKFYSCVEDYAKANDCWRKNRKKVRQLRKANKNTGVEFEDNWTSDLDDEEFTAMLGLDTADLYAVEQEDSAGLMDIDDEDRRMLSTEIDWATSGKMGPVKSQGYCGSCWSFAATSAQEAMQAIKDNAPVVRLSEQEGVDCTTNTQKNYDKFGEVYGTYGCRGGWMARYWNFSRANGSMSNDDYPYVDMYYSSGDPVQECAHDDSKIVSRAGASGQISGTVGDAVSKLQDGPLTMAVAAGNDCWRYYKSGVLSSANGCPTSLDHAVVAVGIATETVTIPGEEGRTTTTCRRATRKERKAKSCPGDAYYRRRRCCIRETTEGTPDSTEDVLVWKIQNSWSTGWGDEGFIKLKVEGGAGVSGSNQVIEWITVDDL